jgi:electron transfer flavoprotein beta subunit
MNIVVCLKQVPDTGTRIQLSKEGGINESGIEWIINPYDEFAVEEALRIKERKQKAEVTVLSIGPARVEKTLRRALAMGADRACLIETDKKIDPSFVAQTLAQIIINEKADLIITGKAGIDENHSATGAMLAEQLSLPHVGFVKTFKEREEGKWLCERQMETGITEEITLCLPALITVEKGINEPRYPSLPGIMKAKKKELKKINLSSLNPPDSNITHFHSYRLPAPPPTPTLPRLSGEGVGLGEVFAPLLAQSAPTAPARVGRSGARCRWACGRWGRPPASGGRRRA